MQLICDPILVINTVLCVIIFAFGFIKKSIISFLIGAAFGIFAISHLVNMMGYKTELESLMIVIRFLAYVLVIIAMIKMKR